MQPINETDYKSLFSQLIKKQILILGPDITLAKVANVTGLTVDLNGDVQRIDGDPQLLLQSLINQFVELSGMIVKKTMESILTSYPGMMAMASSPIFNGGSVSPSIKPTIQVTEVVSQPKMAGAGGTGGDNVPASFSSKEMADLNKALEDLSKAPLSTENAQPQ